MDAKFTATVRQIVELLVARDYDRITDITNKQRLDAEAIERAVREYGRELVMPPREVLDQPDVIEVKNAVPPRWSVRLSLWTLEEGSSDLSLELSLIKQGGDYRVEIDDIHVL